MKETFNQSSQKLESLHIKHHGRFADVLQQSHCTEPTTFSEAQSNFSSSLRTAYLKSHAA